MKGPAPVEGGLQAPRAPSGGGGAVIKTSERSRTESAVGEEDTFLLCYGKESDGDHDDLRSHPHLGTPRGPPSRAGDGCRGAGGVSVSAPTPDAWMDM